MDFEQGIEWLEPQPERPDPQNPGKILPARAGAICRSDEDFTRQKIAIEQACALLGKRCTPELRAEIDRYGGNTKQLLKNAEKKKRDLRIHSAEDPEHEPVE